VLDAFAAAHPDRIDFVSMGVDPSDPDLQSTADGNYGLVVHDEDGNPVTVVTQGRRYHRAILADTIRTFPTRRTSWLSPPALGLRTSTSIRICRLQTTWRRRRRKSSRP
jgi:hypothetical protein